MNKHHLWLAIIRGDRVGEKKTLEKNKLDSRIAIV